MRIHTTTFEEELANRLQTAEAELAELRSQLDHYDRLATIGTLAAGAVHEINNLLTPALAYAQLAQSQPHDQVLTTKAIEHCVTAVNSATQMADVILGFASPDDVTCSTDLRAIVDRALLCLGCEPAMDSISILHEVPENVKAAISPLSLQQVLLNLLINATNALKDRKGGRIAIEASTNSQTVQIRVCDNGPGLPTNVRESLFSPFVSRETAGSGLGLWVCKRLIDEADGDIACTSSSQGTTFTITLPAA